MKPSVIIRKATHRPGSVLVISVIMLLAISAFVITLFNRASQNVSTTSRRINDPATTTIAEAGIEKAVWCLNNFSAPISVCPQNGSGQFVGESNVSIGAGQYTSAVVVTGQTATITVTATTPGLGGGSRKVIQAELQQAASINPSFQFGVQTGEGGIIMSNNAQVIGNVYTNGSITGSNGSSVTGDAVLAVSSPTIDATADPSVSPLFTKNIGDASNTIYLAQRFVSSINDSVYSLDLKLAKHGSAPTMTAYIYSDVSGAPGANISGSGQVLNAAFPFDSPGGWEASWTNQIFQPSTILLANTPYWLVLKAANSNSTKYWTTVRGLDDSSYTNGSASIGSSIAGLSPLNYDIAFRVRLGGQYPTLDVPTVGGSAYAHNMSKVTVGKEAYYQSLSGTVKANGGSETCSLSNGTHCHPNSPDEPPQNFPISDAQIAQMESIAAAGGVTTCSTTCYIHNGQTIGPQKYVGNVTFDGNAVVTLGGTIWVQGNLNISNNAVLQLASGYSSSNGIVIADNPNDRATSGAITFSNNGNLIGSGYASCAGSPKKCSDGLNKDNICSVSTDCPLNAIMAISNNADPAQTTPAIDVANNLSAGVIYAPHGMVSISNNASLKEVTAQKLVLQNNSSVKYLTGLASAIFSSGPGASWQLKPGSYHIVE